MQQYTQKRVTQAQTRCCYPKIAVMKAHLLLGNLHLLFVLFFSTAEVIQMVSTEIWTWISFVLDMSNQTV